MHHPVDTGELEANLEKAVDVLRRAESVSVLTGAGVSAESGVATFRGSGGLWEGYRIEDVATPEAFQRDPALVWKFYNMRRAALRTVKPNPGHYALARLESAWTSSRFTLITQNIDGLHQLAGSKHVLEIHGNLAWVRCSSCGVTANRRFEPLPDEPLCEACGKRLRPAVVWFHEYLPEEVWSEASEKVAGSQCLLVVGTSAIVYPAAGLIQAARRLEIPVIEVNLEATEISHHDLIGLYGPSGAILPQLVQRLNLPE
jgi:NAD-dependent deacetylase